MEQTVRKHLQSLNIFMYPPAPSLLFYWRFDCASPIDPSNLMTMSELSGKSAKEFAARYSRKYVLTALSNCLWLQRPPPLLRPSYKTPNHIQRERIYRFKKPPLL